VTDLCKTSCYRQSFPCVAGAEAIESSWRIKMLGPRLSTRPYRALPTPGSSWMEVQDGILQPHGGRRDVELSSPAPEAPRSSLTPRGHSGSSSTNPRLLTELVICLCRRLGGRDAGAGEAFSQSCTQGIVGKASHITLHANHQSRFL